MEVRPGKKFRSHCAPLAMKSIGANKIQRITACFKTAEESSTISMVLIDYNYDGKTFDLDEVLFESDFKEEKAKFDSSKIKKQAMLIFVDDSGNEKKVIVNE